MITKSCCGYEFSAKDIKPPLMNAADSLKQERVLGGVAKRFSLSECPECGTPYTLWLKPERNTYTVKAISKRGDPKPKQEETVEPAEAKPKRTYTRRTE